MRQASKARSRWFYERLSEKDYKLTKPRQAILGVLNKRTIHFSAEEIFMDVHNVFPTIGMATIYRNLELLVRIGLVLKFDFGDGKARYELTQTPQEVHHHHLICKKCNKVIDYAQSIDDEKRFVRRRQKNLSKKYDFRIDGHFIDFFGLCKQCSSKVEKQIVNNKRK